MGKDIPSTYFSKEDFEEFSRRLREESKLLMDWFDNNAFKRTRGKCGFELEMWLVDENYLPSPTNEEFLKKVSSHLVVPELAKFNFEINSTPHELEGPLLSQLERELTSVWQHCAKIAGEMGSNILAVGILPTVLNHHLTLNQMSPLNRYFALNRQVLKQRGERPFELKIEGRDSLHIKHHDVMLEAAATSLQIHLQVNASEAVRHYNTAHIISAFTVAAAANSPYLFGKDLWDETRIPTFEQAVAIASFRDSRGDMVERVTFGTGYGRNSLVEPFLENLDGFPVLIPLVFDEEPSQLNHLCLHNGTIWRWNRPLIALDSAGIPHIRIEHRVTAAGPSIVDTVANIALFLGLMTHYVHTEIPLETRIPFENAKNNFYQAAKHGLEANIKWIDGKEIQIQKLLLEDLLPRAKKGLLKAGLISEDITYYIDDIIEPRIRTGKNGTSWQRAFITTHGFDFQEMTHIYCENQKQNRPVHEWTV